jgi:hypothetical protein
MWIRYSASILFVFLLISGCLSGDATQSDSELNSKSDSNTETIDSSVTPVSSGGCSVHSTVTGAIITCSDGTSAEIFNGETGEGQVVEGSDGLQGETGIQGETGPRGDVGARGDSCMVIDTAEGAQIICEDGSTADIFDGITEVVSEGGEVLGEHNHFGEIWTGSGAYGLKINNTLSFGKTPMGVYGETTIPNGYGLYTPNRAFVGNDLIIGSDGDIIDSTPVSFLVHVGESYIATSDEPSYKIGFDTEDFDYGNNFDPKLGRFSSRNNGVYHFDVIVSLKDLTANQLTKLVLYKNGEFLYILDRELYVDDPDSPTIAGTLTSSITLELLKDDYIEIYVVAGVLSSPDTSIVIQGIGSGWTHLSGFRVS